MKRRKPRIHQSMRTKRRDRRRRLVPITRDSGFLDRFYEANKKPPISGPLY